MGDGRQSRLVKRAVLDVCGSSVRVCGWLGTLLILAHASAAGGVLPGLCGLGLSVPCAGDCDGSGRVEVGELVEAVGVALGEHGLARCSNADVRGDGRVGIDDLLSAVDSALHGCVRFAECPLGAVYVGLAEHVDREHLTGPQLFVRVSTVEQFPCANYRISGGAGVKGGTVRVHLGGPRPPSICLTAFGPASLSAELALDDGEYTFELESGGDVDTYRLALTPTHIELMPVETSFSSAPRPLTPRIPREVIVVHCYRVQWGDEDPATRVDELCPLLFGAVEAIASPAGGVDPSALPTHCEAADYASGTCRTYTYGGDVDDLFAAVEGARQTPLPHGHHDAHGRALYYDLVVTWLGHTF